MIDQRDARITEILAIVLSMAQMDFSKRIEFNGEDDEMNALAAGINMLGEELEASVISVQQKDTLLREIHHRIKNNLQIVSSILNLQSASLLDEYSRGKFEQCQTRILAIALLHEKLYNSQNVQHVEINDYLISLSRSLLKTVPSEHVEFSFSPMREDHYTNIDHLLPLGLILNELITNSLKHAFPNAISGKLTVGLKLEMPSQMIVLTVEDNGVGFDPAAIAENTLGFQLIEELASQLGGELDVQPRSGTKWILKFCVNSQESND